jgi:hypothetical protein
LDINILKNSLICLLPVYIMTDRFLDSLTARQYGEVVLPDAVPGSVHIL